MASPEALLRPPPLPIERLLFDSPLARVGTFRCPAGHPLFRDSGPIVNPVFVFPRTAVWIQHDGDAPFVSDPTIATLYNRGQTYKRRVLSAMGDRCEWFALAPRTLADIAATWNPGAADRPEQPFALPRTTVDSWTYLRQRRLVDALARGCCEPLFVEEAVVWLAARVLRSAAESDGPRHRQPPAFTRAARAHREHVEHARALLAARFTQTLSLAELAALVGVSAFHLCRVFRHQTGRTLHEHRTELRMRQALERLPDYVANVTQLALDLGFSSHSHFTAAFRRTYGITPSAVTKNQARLGSPREVAATSATRRAPRRRRTRPQSPPLQQPPSPAER